MPKFKIPKRPSICDNKLSFHECELAVLRQSVDKNEKIRNIKVVSNDQVKDILKIVEEFIIHKKLVCYGGTAINNILPIHAQFYNREVELPDYDFFSSNALNDAKELADIYYKAGYEDVEAKSGVHKGTFKVFVNYIPIADITEMVDSLFKTIQTESIIKAGIRYAPINYLRMSMYLELSRPKGDISRWEKVLKRLTLLNKFYPLKTPHCDKIDFQRDMVTVDSIDNSSTNLYDIIRSSFINQGVVFFGAYAVSSYSKYMPKNIKHSLRKVPDFDVLSDDIERTSLILTEELNQAGFKDVTTVDIEKIGELIPRKIQVSLGKEVIAYIYEPIACHSYNTIKVHNSQINVATIDTILTFYLSFLYTKLNEYNSDRLLCMAKFLYDVEEKNRLNQKGLLKRFTMKCIGKQPTIEDMRSEKAVKFKELKNNRNCKEFERLFLRYIPSQEADKINSQNELKKNKKTGNLNSKKTMKNKRNKKAKNKSVKTDILTRIKTLLT